MKKLLLIAVAMITGASVVDTVEAFTSGNGLICCRPAGGARKNDKARPMTVAECQQHGNAEIADSVCTRNAIVAAFPVVVKARGTSFRCHDKGGEACLNDTTNNWSVDYCACHQI